MVLHLVIRVRAAYGCVMWDSYGNVTGVKGGLLGHCDAIHAKTLGLLEGLKLAKSKGVNRCILEGDFLTVITWGRGGKGCSWRLDHFFLEIRSFIKEVDAEIHHVPQAQNSLADRIAKWSVGQSHMFVGDYA